MKPPKPLKVKTFEGSANYNTLTGRDGIEYGVAARKTQPKREPDIVVTVEEEPVKMWFGKDWVALISEAGMVSHLSECPRSGLLMMSFSQYASEEEWVHDSWAYAAGSMQHAFKEYKATYDLEEAMLRT